MLQKKGARYACARTDEVEREPDEAEPARRFAKCGGSGGAACDDN